MTNENITAAVKLLIIIVTFGFWFNNVRKFKASKDSFARQGYIFSGVTWFSIFLTNLYSL